VLHAHTSHGQYAIWKVLYIPEGVVVFFFLAIIRVQLCILLKVDNEILLICP
jgi:hypothetical protein